MVYQDYVNRALELNQQVLSSVEHGFQGNYLRCWQAAQKAGLKFIYGAEAYWVPNRLEKDRSNRHIVLLAKTKNGLYQINEVLSQANEDGYYAVPRLDMELLHRLDPRDVMATTACVAFWGKVDRETNLLVPFEDHELLLEDMALHFGDSLFLEVQAHHTPWQREVNQKCLHYARSLGLPLIAGLDSHYIYPEQRQERQFLREESGIKFAEGDHELDESVFEDYPDEATAHDRFTRQGVLTESEIAEAIQATDLLLDFEDITFDTSRKFPTLYPDMPQEGRNALYLSHIKEAWDKYKVNVDPALWPRYEAGIKEETDVVTSTNTSDYFLVNEAGFRRGREVYGGIVTPTGRGSASSFFTNTLLGLSTMDRFSLPVQLHPSRFVTADRLKTGVPDIDVNVSAQEPFINAFKDLLGAEHFYPFIAWGTLKDKSAFRLFARANQLPMETQNEVVAQIEKYDTAKKHADEDEEVFIEDYVAGEYLPYLEGSKPYKGIIVSASQAPCGFLMYSGDIRREIGLIRVASPSSGSSTLCTVIDGYTADEFGYVKSDILVVKVLDVNYGAMKRAGLPPLTSSDIIRRVDGDKKTWEIFYKGWTMGINQCEQEGARQKLAAYRPNCLKDLSAFVAAIRPGFKSMVHKFLGREKFSYGVPAFDSLLQNDSSGSSWLLYQENIMSVLALAGFSLEETYPIIKAISKKKTSVIESAKPRFLSGFGDYIVKCENKSPNEALRDAENAWQVIIDSASYLFNACVSGSESIWRDNTGRWKPTIEEMYLTMHDKEWAKKTGHVVLHDKYKRNGNYGTSLSMHQDEKLRFNIVEDIRQAGVQSVWEVSTEYGASIKCTANHKFPTPNGEKMLCELSVGDKLYVKTPYRKNKFDSTFTDGSSSNLPIKGQRGFQRIPNGASVVYNRTRADNVSNRRSCEDCGKAYSQEYRFELHHEDFDRHNNTPENLRWLCVSCHKKRHYKNGRTKRWNSGCLVQETSITSIRYLRDEMTYDIEMAHPYHTWCTSSGLVSCNSHSVAVSLDALYGAYLKAHYPFAYYPALLTMLENKKDKDRIALVKAEMKAAFGISVAPCRFGRDNRDYDVDEEAKTISDSLTSIKFMSRQCAEELYRAGMAKWNSFADLYHHLAMETCLNSRQIDILILLGYFKDFGSRHKLDCIAQAYRQGPLKITRTLKEATREKRLALLRAMEQDLAEEEPSAEAILSGEIEYIGLPISVFPEKQGLYCVLEANTSFSPRVKLYNAANGNSAVVKMKKGYFSQYPLAKGDAIRMGAWQRKPSCTFSGGKRQVIPGKYDLWVYDYEILFRKEAEKSAEEAA